MTNAPEVPQVSFSTLNGAVTAMRARGLRLSTVRRLILEALFAAEGPVSTEHLAHGLNLDLASVYRNLEAMERHGIVRHVHLGHGPGLYVLIGRGESAYLYCDRCGSVKAVSSNELDPVRAKVKELFGYEARFSHFPIIGLCHLCASTDDRGCKAGPRSTRPIGGSEMSHDEHSHEHPHSHEHSHDNEVHSHPHTTHDHAHTEHEHEHSHGDFVHAHPHEHEQGLERDHAHPHAPEEGLE